MSRLIRVLDGLIQDAISRQLVEATTILKMRKRNDTD